MLLMVEKGIKGGICQARHRHTRANNKYMKNYNKDIISSYLMYLHANNLYGWPMSRRLPVNGFEWVTNLSEYNSIQFNKSFIKNYDENSNMGYFFRNRHWLSKKLFSLYKDLPLLPEIKKKKK